MEINYNKEIEWLKYQLVETRRIISSFELLESQGCGHSIMLDSMKCKEKDLMSKLENIQTTDSNL